MSNYYNSQSSSSSTGRQVISDFERSPALFLVNKGITFLQNHYIFSTLWIVGLLIFSLAKGYVVDHSTQTEYRRALYHADSIKDTSFENAQRGVDATYSRYYHSKGWFGRCDTYCQSNYESYLSAMNEFKHEKAKHDSAVSEANQIVGVFSEYGVSQARLLFWDCWQWGKDFAKRISYYDAIFLMFDSRDESFWVYIARFVVRILMNFTIGFISGLISFIWQLWWFVKSYGGGITGILFFLIGGLAAWSLIVTMIVAMYAGTAATVGGVMMMAQNQAIRDGRGRQRRTRHVHYQ